MIHPPRQARSRDRLEAILDAAEALLESTPFEQISISEIIARAGCSTGSFYARFSSKDALLPELYARYNADLPARLRGIEAVLQGECSLRQACDRVVEELAGFFATRKNLMRAIALFARSPAFAASPPTDGRADIQQQLVALFRPFRGDIRRGEPEQAVRTGLFFAASVLREGILFPDAPFAAHSRLSAARLKQESAALLFAYLTSEPQ